MSRLLFASVVVFFLSFHGGYRRDVPEIRDWQVVGSPETCVDVLFIGDGYVQSDLGLAGKYWVDVDRCAKRLLELEPFAHFKRRFNVRGMLLESHDRGCDESLDVDEVDTALDCRFDTKTGRALFFKNEARLVELVKAAGPTDIVFVMVNTRRSGGSGAVLRKLMVRGRPMPAPIFSAQDGMSFMIAVHELGHSFANLADEYDDDEEQARKWKLPEKGRDLDSPNVTMAGHFDASSFKQLAATVKWGHFLALPDSEQRSWVYEGAHYRKKGVFRPWLTCCMRDRGEPFCPICEEEIAKKIVECCGDAWDDAKWHKERPLSGWELP